MLQAYCRRSVWTACTTHQPSYSRTYLYEQSLNSTVQLTTKCYKHYKLNDERCDELLNCHLFHRPCIVVVSFWQRLAAISVCPSVISFILGSPKPEVGHSVFHRSISNAAMISNVVAIYWRERERERRPLDCLVSSVFELQSDPHQVAARWFLVGLRPFLFRNSTAHVSLTNSQSRFILQIWGAS